MNLSKGSDNHHPDACEQVLKALTVYIDEVKNEVRVNRWRTLSPYVCGRELDVNSEKFW